MFSFTRTVHPFQKPSTPATTQPQPGQTSGKLVDRRISANHAVFQAFGHLDASALRKEAERISTVAKTMGKLPDIAKRYRELSASLELMASRKEADVKRAERAETSH